MEAHKLGAIKKKKKKFNQAPALTSTSSLSLGWMLDEDEGSSELQVASLTLDLLFPPQALNERPHNLNDPKSMKISRKTT